VLDEHERYPGLPRDVLEELYEGLHCRRARAAVVGSVSGRLLATRFVRWTVLFIYDRSPSIASTDSDTAQPQNAAGKYHEGSPGRSQTSMQIPRGSNCPRPDFRAIQYGDCNQARGISQL
jgi:hypothetical protein